MHNQKCSESTQKLKINILNLTFCLTISIVLGLSFAFSLLVAVAFLVAIRSLTYTSLSLVSFTSVVATRCSVLLSFVEGHPVTVFDPFCIDEVCHTFASI